MSTNLATHVRRGEWLDVARVVRAHPQLVQRKDPKSRQFVLFMAIDNDAPPEVVLQLLKAFPAAVKQASSDDFGRRCVHLVLEKRCSRSVILNIISTHPGDMQVADRVGRKPLHYLRDFQFEPEFVGRLCTWLRKKNEVNIGQACMYAAWDVVRSGLSDPAGRSSLSLKDQAGVLPVEWAAWHTNTPEDILHELQTLTYPEGSTSLLELCSAAMWDEAERLLDAGGHSANVSTRNEHGQTPLHIALQNRAPLSVVQKLLLIDPDVCKHHDEYHIYPLVVAIFRRLSLDYITLLTNAYRGLLQHHVDVRHSLKPVDVARKEKMGKDIVQYLAISTFPEPTRPRSGSGHGPATGKNGLVWPAVKGVETIDAACEYGMWVRVVMFANEQKKGAQTLSTVGRRDGKLPLHMAVINEAPLSVLQVMVRLYPAARAVKDRHGLKPLDYAVRMKLGSSFLDLLDEAHVVEDAASTAAAWSPESSDIPTPEQIDAMSSEDMKAAITRLANLLRHERALNSAATKPSNNTVNTGTAVSGGGAAVSEGEEAAETLQPLDDGLVGVL